MKKSIALLVSSLCLLSSFPSQAMSVPQEKTAVVYIGDSRTVQMDQVVGLSDMPDTFVVAKSAMGYDWFMSTGSAMLYEIRNEHQEYDRWVYLFNLGINDLRNIVEYRMLIPSLESDATVYFVSINPTIDSFGGVQCSRIEEFNEMIKPFCVHYIDSYSYLQNVGFSAADGLHYDIATYQKLYDFLDLSVRLNEFISESENTAPGDYVTYLVSK